MGKNDTLRNLLIAGGVFALAMALIPRTIPPLPETGEPVVGDSAEATDMPSVFPEDDAKTDDSKASATPPPQDTADPAPTKPTADSPYQVVEAEAPETRIMGSELLLADAEDETESPYRMRLTLSNIGASVETATMTDHAATLGSVERYVLLSSIERPDGRTERSLAVERLFIDDVELDLHDKRWNVGAVEETETGQRISFSIEVQDAGKALVRLTRTFELPRQARNSGRHDLDSNLTVENLSTDTHRVAVAYLGGVGVLAIPGARSAGAVIDSSVHDGARTNGSRTPFVTVSGTEGGMTPLFSPSRALPNSRFSWAATGNTYFTCTLAPISFDGKDNPPYVASAVALDLDGQPLTTDDVTIRIATVRQELQAGRSLSFATQIFIGEKDGASFRDEPDYARRDYYFQVSKSFGMCTFTWLVKLMIALLNGLHSVFTDYGVAIIFLVLIVRSMLHPITKKGQVNMVRMQSSMGELTPKLEELKRRFANDKARLQQETMKLYRDMGINPATQVFSCLPMMLQMPIWVALFLSLSNNIGMRHQPFLFTWIQDLTAPDALYTFATPLVIPVVGWTLPSFNLLPLLVSLFMYMQQKLQPKPKPNPNATDQQRQQQEMMQKMMPMMSIMMLLFFYKMPSGLNLYIMASSAFGIIEQRYIRRHIKEQEAAGTLHKPASLPVAVTPDAAATPGKLTFFQKLQKMADEAQKAQAQQAKKKGKGRN